MSTAIQQLQHGCGLRLGGVSILSGLVYERPVFIDAGVSCRNTYMGAFSYVARKTDIWNGRIGRYCCIGDNLTIGTPRHPHAWMTTALFPYATYNYFRTMTSSGSLPAETTVPLNFIDYPSITTIGHDVWFGKNSIVPSYHPTTIGNGAVIAAHAVVTKDVPPYAVAAGNPARVVKLRFKEEVCADLAASNWWNYDWTAFAAAHPEQWMAAPYSEPERFVRWWQTEGYELLRSFPIAGQKFVVNFDGKNMNIGKYESKSSEDPTLTEKPSVYETEKPSAYERERERERATKTNS